jgi:hypothetical protein
MRSLNHASGNPRRRWTTLVPWVLVAILVCANVASILSVRVHAIAFRAIEAVLTPLGAHVAESALAASPMRVAARERQALAKVSVVARDVAKRTTTRLALHASESVASVPVRVMPYVGTVAIVGMTAYDVRSDCATVGEINEIMGALGAPGEDPGIVCKYVSKVPSASDAWASAKAGAGGAAAKVMELAERLLRR